MSPSRPLAIVLLCLLPVLGQADGASWKVAADWPRIEEKVQAALIAHADGRQRMALAVRLEMLAGDQGLWLVPVRGAPTEVRVALAPVLPWFHGGTPHPDRAAREDVANIAGLAALAAAPGSPLSLGLAGMAIPGLLASRSSRGELGATVNGEGLVATVLAARSADELAGMLAGLGRAVPAASLAGFAPYLDGAHSLVAVRLDGLTAATGSGRAPALLLDFPSREPWFPLQASAGAGRTQAYIQLVGWWKVASGPLRCDPVAGGMVKETGNAMTLDWLGLKTGSTAPHHTRCSWWGGEPDQFAKDLTWVPDQRPELMRGVALLSLERFGILVWLLFLPCGALAGAALGWLLLRRPGWGALCGASFGIGGLLPMWGLAHLTARRLVRDPLPSPAWPRMSPLNLIPMLSTVVLSFIMGIMISVSGMEVDSAYGLPVSIIALLGLHALLWLRWAWRRRATDSDDTVLVRRYAAWGYAAPSLAAIIVALGVLPVLAWLGA